MKFHGQSMYSYQTHNDRIVVCTWKIKFIIVKEPHGILYQGYIAQERLLRLQTKNSAEKKAVVPSDSTITKTVWQFSEPLPEETMAFLKGVAACAK